MKALLFLSRHHVVTLLAVVFLTSYLQARIYYVSIQANGTGDGVTWINAFTELQPAINIAETGDTICVAMGTYLPTEMFFGDSVRHKTFFIDKDIKLFGGYTGQPGTEGDLNVRDPLVHVTVLSGDLGITLDTWDNAYHVVYIRHVTADMRLDGFTISGGTAFGGSGLELYGAGIFNDGQELNSHPVIANCIIRDNHAMESGGGMMNYAAFGGRANPTLLNCRFVSNHASGGGGLAVVAEGGTGNPVMINTHFYGNVAETAQGSAILCIFHSSISSPKLTNCIITGNHSLTSPAVEFLVTGSGKAHPFFTNCTFAGNAGGALRVNDIGAMGSIIEIFNCIFWGNRTGHGFTFSGGSPMVKYSVMQNGFNGENITAEDPQFVEAPLADEAPHTNGDVRLQAGSSAIDAGLNSLVPADILTDADHNPRFFNSTSKDSAIVDIGAFEFQEVIAAVHDGVDVYHWTINPNPAGNVITIVFPDSESEATVTLFDAHGIMAHHALAKAGENELVLHLSHLPGGIYWVQHACAGRTHVRSIVLTED